MKKAIYFLLFLSACNAAFAQLNRGQMAGNITSNIYTNGRNAITGADAQAVMINQNNSYANLISDTNLLDVRLFSPYATYTPGMGVFYGDTLWMNLQQAHGTWNSSQWLRVAEAGCICSSYVKYADSVNGSGIGKFETQYSLAQALDSYIPLADTVTKIVTKKSMDTYVASIALTGSITGTVGTGGGAPTIATTIANGVVTIANLSATGTPGTGNFLRGDYSFAVPPSYVKDSVPLLAWSLIGNAITSGQFFGTTNMENLIGERDDTIVIEFGNARYFNIGIGQGALAKMFAAGDGTGGMANTAMGRNALGGNMSTTNNSIGFNTACGANAFGAAFTVSNGCAFNSAFGANTATDFQMEGAWNLFLGGGSNLSVSQTWTGNFNFSVMPAALGHNTSGTNNLAIGDSALIINTSGNYNIAYGHLAGNTNTTGSGNIFLGPGAVASSATISNTFWLPKTLSNVIGGTGIYVTTAGQVRDTTIVVTHNITTPSSGGTVSLVNHIINIIAPTGTLATLTVTLPSSPSNNDIVYVKFTQPITSLTYSGGTVVGNPTTITTGQLIMLTYDSVTTSWY